MVGARKFVLGCVGGLLGIGLLGCTPQHPAEVPGSASLVASGDREVEYTTPSRGMVYLYDSNNHRLVWSGEVDQGKTIKVERPSNRVTVSGMPVVTKLQPFHMEEIYFTSARDIGLVNPPPPASSDASNAGVTVTPHATVAAPSDQASPSSGSVTISPSLSVSPTTQPAQRP